MNIIYISYSKIPSRGANSIQVMKMCAAFASLGHQVALYAIKGEDLGINEDEFYGIKDNERFQKIKIRVPNIPGLRKFWYTWNIFLRLLSQPKPDICYGRDAFYSLAAAAMFGYPIILEVHMPPRNALEKWIIRWLSKRVNFYRLVAISQPLGDIYHRLLPQLKIEKFTIAQDGADSVDVKRLPQLPSLGRENVLQVGYSGHLYEGRGLEVICSLAECMPEVDFHIVGGQDEHIRIWREKCDSLNLYFHGFIVPKDVPSFLNRCDILLAPYQRKVSVSGNKGNTASWMSPLKIFEYMSVGKPIICSNLPALREVLTPEADCIMVEPDDPQMWAQAILRLNDRQFRDAIGQAAQTKFNQQYSWPKRAEYVLNSLQIAQIG